MSNKRAFFTALLLGLTIITGLLLAMPAMAARQPAAGLAAPPPPEVLWTEGFEVSVPPPNWVMTDVVGSLGDWTQETAGVNPTAAPHGGSYLATFNSYSADSGDMTRLYTTSVDFSDAGYFYFVSFWMYHDSAYSLRNDRIQIEVDDNSGWVDVGAAVLRYRSGTAAWDNHTVDLSAYAGQVISLSIKGISDYGNNIHIDDVEVYRTPPYAEYDSPYTYKQAPYYVEEGEVFEYILHVTNTGHIAGANTVINDILPAGVAHTGGAASWLALGAGVSGSLDDQAAYVSWSGQVPASQGLIITIPVTVIGDVNDLITNTATITDPVSYATPVTLTTVSQVQRPGAIFYYADFNADNGNLVGNNEWEWGLPGGPSPSAHSRPRLWGTDLDDNYDDGTTSVLTAVIDLSAATSPTADLLWWEWLNTEESSDEAFVEISSDSTPTPTLIYGQKSGGLTSDQRNHESMWREFQFNVTPYLGEKITLTFTLQPNVSNNAEGWYIDDLAVRLQPPMPDFAGSYKTVDRYKVEIGQLLTYTVYITNSGQAASTHGRMYDFLPAWLQVHHASLVGAGSLITGLNTVEWTTSDAYPMGAGEDATITIVALAPHYLECDETFTNTALITDTMARFDTPVAAHSVTAYPAIHVYNDFETNDGGFIAASAVITHPGWEWGVPAYVNGPAVAYSGDKVWATNLTGNYTDSTVITLTTPVYDLSGVDMTHALYMQWWQWLSIEKWYPSSAGEKAWVEVTSDGGATWSKVWEHRATSSIPPASASWQHIYANISAYRGSSSFQARFVLTSDDFSNYPGWYVDEFALHQGCEIATPEFAGSYKTADWSKLNAGDQLSYTLYIVNSGTFTSTDGRMYDAMPAGFQIASVSMVGAGSLVSGTDYVEWTSSPAAPMGPGEDAAITIVVDTPADAECGTVFINTAVITDTFASNDVTIAAPVSIYPVIHYAENLEAGDGGFSADTNMPAAPGWEWGAPAYVNGPAHAHSGINVWGTNLTGEYTNALTITLTSPAYDLSGVDMAYPIYLQWWDWLDTAWSDWARVYISATNSSGWVLVWSDPGGFPYDWSEKVVDLTLYRGEMVRVRFEFASSPSAGTAAGWYIDDLAIHQGCTVLSPEFTTSWKDGPSKVKPGSVYTYTVHAINSGWADATAAAITDTLPAGAEYAGGASAVGGVGGSISASGNQVWWTGSITAGQAVTFYIPFTATAACGDVFTNSVVIVDPAASPVTIYSPIAAAYENLYYAWDLEANDGGFTGNNDWQWGEPNGAGGPSRGHSGFKVWGVYTTNVTSLLTRTLDLTSVITDNRILRLQWWDWLRLPGTLDSVHVYINGTEVWDNWLNNQAYWAEHSINITDYAGQIITLTFSSNSTTEYAGWYLDDIAVHLDCEVPAPVLSLNKEAPAWVAPGGQMTYVIDVDNSGFADAASVVLTDTLDPGTTYAGGASANIGSLDDSQGAAGIIKWSGTITQGVPLQVTIPVVASANCGEMVTNTVVVAHDSLGAPLVAQAATQLVGAPVLNEGFEGAGFPPAGWALAVVVASSPSPTWTQEAVTLHPAGYLPHRGGYMARFNSYDVGNDGSARLYYSAGVDLLGATNPELAFWMFHDDGSLTNPLDRVQVEVSTDGGNTFSNVGDPVTRWSLATGWISHSVDLSTYTGQSNVIVSLKGVSDYGNDVYVDDVVVYKGCGASVAPVAGFSAAPLSGTAPLTVYFTDTSTYTPTTWLWNFGDSGTSDAQHPTHTYSAPGVYTVTLTVSNAGGSDTEIKTSYITVNPPPVAPVANFVAAPLSGTAPLTVYFTDTSTYTPTTWAWNFGDGGTSDVQHPTHVYNAPGVFTVTLTASNAGGSDIEVKTSYITVEPSPVITPPVAGFVAAPLSGTAPLTVYFTDTSTYTPTMWAWNFGDGGASDVQHPTHVYNAPGVFTVTLTASNAGGSDIEVKTSYITVTMAQRKIYLPLVMKNS